MNRRDALRTIEQLTQEGKSKQEIFGALSSRVRFRSDLLQYIAMVPSKEKQSQYRKLNIVLFALLIVVSVLKLLMAMVIVSRISVYALPFAFIVPMLTVYFAVAVWKFRGNMYRILGMLGIAGIGMSLSHLKVEGLSTLSGILLAVVDYAPAFLIVYLAFYIGSKVFPYYGFRGQLQEKKLGIAS
jgi:hypothetical protein